MNLRNILTVVTLYDDTRNKVKQQAFLTKNGKLYKLNEENKFKYCDNTQSREQFGLTGKELLKEYSDDCTELFQKDKGIIELNDDLINKILQGGETFEYY